VTICFKYYKEKKLWFGIDICVKCLKKGEGTLT
jgi:hypothetical protein